MGFLVDVESASCFPMFPEDRAAHWVVCLVAGSLVGSRSGREAPIGCVVGKKSLTAGVVWGGPLAQGQIVNLQPGFRTRLGVHLLEYRESYKTGWKPAQPVWSVVVMSETGSMFW